MVSENEMNLMIIVGIILLLVYFYMNKSEGLENVKKTRGGSYTYNPRSFQPVISEQAEDDGFIPLPKEAEYPWSKNTGNYGETDMLDDGDNGNMSLQYNLCSKSCCSSQYPPPFSITPDDYVLLSNKDYVPSNMTCNNAWQDSGCLCLTKEQALFLNSRGSNASSSL